MPFLGDFLGQLMAEVTMARLHADLETVRLAELYAGHDLLRHLPVPRFRLPDVDVDVPVLIKGTGELPAGTSVRGGATLPVMRERFGVALDGLLEQSGVTLNAADRNRLRTELDRKVGQLEQPSETSVGVHHVADELAETAAKFMDSLGRGSIPRPGLPTVDSIKDLARVELLKARQPPPRLMALVTSSEIREAGTENVARLRLKISEQGLEWSSVESGGTAKGRLIPE